MPGKKKSKNKKISKEQRIAYEQYLLAGDDELLRKEAISANFVKGSLSYDHLYFLDRFKKFQADPLAELDLTPEEEAVLADKFSLESEY